jgi:hypothetical protein
VAQVLESQSSKHKALSSNSSTSKKEEEEKNTYMFTKAKAIKTTNRSGLYREGILF